MLYRVIDDLACRVAKEGGPDIAMRFHAGLSQYLDSGRNSGVRLVRALGRHGHTGLHRQLALPQVQDALETATKGITVNCVIPGAIRTDMVDSLPENIVQAGVDNIPMHALGTPEDVAEAVRYLVSDEAHYLTGTLIPVAGGWLMM